MQVKKHIQTTKTSILNAAKSYIEDFCLELYQKHQAKYPDKADSEQEKQNIIIGITENLVETQGFIHRVDDKVSLGLYGTIKDAATNFW